MFPAVRKCKFLKIVAYGNVIWKQDHLCVFAMQRLKDVYIDIDSFVL